MLLGITPWYSWFCLFFSIPIIIVDILIMVALSEGFYIIIMVPFPLIHLISTVISFLLAVFGEIILVPLSLLSPILFIGGLIGWIIGDL